MANTSLSLLKSVSYRAYALRTRFSATKYSLRKSSLGMAINRDRNFALPSEGLRRLSHFAARIACRLGGSGDGIDALADAVYATCRRMHV
jgi:hypothetical protein